MTPPYSANLKRKSDAEERCRRASIPCNFSDLCHEMSYNFLDDDGIEESTHESFFPADDEAFQ